MKWQSGFHLADDGSSLSSTIWAYPLICWLFPLNMFSVGWLAPIMYNNLVNFSHSSCYGNLRENRSEKQWVGRRNIPSLSPFLLQSWPFASKMPPSRLTHLWLCCVLSSCPNSVKTHVEQSLVFCLVVMLQCRDFLVILHLAIYLVCMWHLLKMNQSLTLIIIPTKLCISISLSVWFNYGPFKMLSASWPVGQSK